MTRTQVQLPDPLYRDIKRLAKAQDWSIAEVLRRGAEAVLRAYPSFKEQKREASTWKLPSPLDMKLLVEDPEKIKEILFEESRSYFPKS